MDNFIYYAYYWPKEKLRYLWVHRIKKIPTRLRIGFWPDECWNLDVTFAKYVLPRLKHFRAMNNGFPHGLTEEEWDSHLDAMIASFEWIGGGNYYDLPIKDGEIDVEAYTKLRLDTQHGLELFAEYYMGLWD